MPNLKTKIKWIGLVGIINLFAFLLGWIARSTYYDIEWEEVFRKNKAEVQEVSSYSIVGDFEKETKYQEVSPERKNIVIEYKLPFTQILYKDYYKDYFSNKKIIAVRDIDSQKEDYIFTGEERVGDPHWLGNDHIFFTTYCGTACQGLYLVDTQNKESKLGVLSYMFSDARGIWETYFKDWFKQEFTFNGLVDDIKSEISNGKTYLIFEVQDNKRNHLGQQRFLFTGDSLKAL